MDSHDKKEITTADLLESINRSFSNLEKKMVTKDEFLSFELQANTHFNNLESDLKSFKTDTKESFSELNKKVSDLEHTEKGYDKRIERLETKVFGSSTLAQA